MFQTKNGRKMRAFSDLSAPGMVPDATRSHREQLYFAEVSTRRQHHRRGN